MPVEISYPERRENPADSARAEHALAVHDKVMYLLIVSTLSTFVNISTNPSPILTRDERLRNQRNALTRLHGYLEPFDTQLAEVYARDSLDVSHLERLLTPLPP